MIISKHEVLKQVYYPLKFIKNITEFIGISSKDSLRVLNFHDIAAYDYVKFEKQLRWLSNSWNFVNPERFSAMVSGYEKINGRNLLITFDDGFLSNRIVAEKVLNPLGIKAIFFCISDFIDIHDNEEAKTFIKDRICLGWSVEKLPIHWKNMNWDDLSALVEQGHTIGAHTKSHARLSTILNTEELKSEIVYSADLIEKKLGISIDHFAYTFGDIDSISKEAIDIAKTRFKYIYSGLRGRNKGRNYGIFRDAAADQDNNMNYYLYSNSLLGSFLEGALDIYYASKRKKLESWYLNK